MWPLAVVAMAARQRETPIAHKRTTHTNAKRRHSFHDPFHEPKANVRIRPSTWEKSIENRTDDLRITRRLTAVQTVTPALLARLLVTHVSGVVQGRY